MDAIIYIRWSSLEQSKGDSYNRQLSICNSFCASQGYNVIETVVDQGRSAYTGENIQTGNLGQLVERFRKREFPEDTIVVVEQIDRLSRLPALDVISWLTNAFSSGISFQTADRGQIVSRKAMEADQLSFMTLIFDSFRSHGESARKSKLISESWSNRRKARREGERKNITGVCPAWLRWDAEQGEFIGITHPTDPKLDRVGIIKRIFNEKDSGFGIAAIAKKLNEDQVPSWGIGKRKSDGWYPSYINKIIHNPAVIGEFQPRSRKKGQVYGVNMGEPITDYYPQIISPALYERVSAKKRLINVGGAAKGKKGNLLAGLAFCYECGQTMQYVHKKAKGRKKVNPSTGSVYVVKNDNFYIRCSGALRGNRCNHKTSFRYDIIEKAILDNLLKLALDDRFFEQEDLSIEISDKLATAKRDKDRLESQIDNALEALLDPDFKNDERLKIRYKSLSDQASEIGENIKNLTDQLMEAKGRVTPKEHSNRVAKVRSSINSEDEYEREAARTVVMEALQSIITRIVFKADKTVEVAAVEGVIGIKLAFDGSVISQFDLTEKMKTDERLKMGMMMRNNEFRKDIEELVDTVRKRSNQN